MKDDLKPGEAEQNDPMLQSALRDFRASVHAWSAHSYDAAYHRARPAVAATPQRIAWRRSIAWGLSLALSFGFLGTAAFEHHQHNVAVARQLQQQREQDRQRALAAQRARETEDLMAKIDSDISREVPAAMEPLAQLMTGEQ